MVPLSGLDVFFIFSDVYIYFLLYILLYLIKKNGFSQITPSVLHKLPLMYPALKMIFAEHFEEMEAKCFKLKLKEEKARVKV
jgi:hypothetical protein